ncbi:MAG: response regulator transcription factor [Phormidesmis sp.]
MIRVLIAEDQEIVRRGLRLLLATQPDIEIAGEAENGQEAIDLIVELNLLDQRPDVVLMDIKMPVMGGVAATKALMNQFPETKIIVLTTFEDNEFVSEALSYGAKGYLLKDTPLEELTDVIRSIAKGYTQFGPGILEKIVANKSIQPAQASPALPTTLPPGFESLTAKEKEVLGLIAQGSNNKEIAAALYVSEGTVRNHISHILGRLNVRDRTQAAIISNAFIPYLTGDESANQTV